MHLFFVHQRGRQDILTGALESVYPHLEVTNGRSNRLLQCANLFASKGSHRSHLSVFLGEFMTQGRSALDLLDLRLTQSHGLSYT